MIKYGILLSVLCIAGVVCVKPQGEMITEVLNTILNKYDSRVRPHHGEKATEVTTTAYLIRGISFKDGLLVLESYFREMWNDPRLAYRPITGFSDNIATRADMQGKIWEPDTFIANGQLRNNGKEMFYRISPDGEVFRSNKYLMESQCLQDMRNYPLDVQYCSVEFESYGYSAKDVFYKFKKGHLIGFAFDVTFEDLYLFGVQQIEKMIHLSTGNYSRLEIKLRLVRNPRYHIKYLFVPAILNFIVCWTIFWLPASAVLLRGILGVMCLKISMSLMARGSKDIPRYAGYLTRLDEYMITCSVLAVISIVESIGAYYLYINRPGSSDKEEEISVDATTLIHKKVANESEKEKLGLGDYLGRGAKYALNLRQHSRSHAKVDIFFRIVFPIFFILFNLIFWVVAYRSLNDRRGVFM